MKSKRNKNPPQKTIQANSWTADPTPRRKKTRQIEATPGVYIQKLQRSQLKYKHWVHIVIVDAGADLRRASDTLIDLGQALCLCVAAIVVRLLCIAAWCPFFAHVIITPPLSRFYADAHLVHTLTYVYIGSVQRGKKQGVA